VRDITQRASFAEPEAIAIARERMTHAVAVLG
jgi:hypothetical protein